MLVTKNVNPFMFAKSKQKIQEKDEAPQKPLNIQEVVAIISDPDWYFEDTTSK